MTRPTVEIDGTSLLHPDYRPILEAGPLFDLQATPIEEVRAQLRGLPFERSGAVEYADHTAPGPDGNELVLRVHRPIAAEGPRPCVYAIHGGGYVLGTYEILDAQLDRFGARLGCVGVSVEYRLAPEHPYPAALDDCLAGLRWVHEHHAELGVDPRRIGIAGTSAGGGLAAALALRARDEGGPPIAFCLLECPMLDDRRRTPSSQLDNLVVWSRESNEFGWRAYLGDLYGRDDVPATAAPARAPDLSGLPPTLVCAGGADGFRDENIEYALRLCQAGVPTELHVYPGVPHGGMLVPDAEATRQWERDVEEWLARRFREPAG